MASKKYNKITDMQLQICDKYASVLCPIAATDMVAVALETLEKTPIYCIRAHKAHAKDNVEWFFYCGENSDADDFYKPIHATHLFEYQPTIEKYLALAPGYRFIIDADGNEDVWLE